MNWRKIARIRHDTNQLSTSDHNDFQEDRQQIRTSGVGKGFVAVDLG